ncbi:MAG: hypothetical protein U1D55_19625 [Phycisphaerae bacterium]
MHLIVFRDPPLDGPTNMARDEHLLHAHDSPAIRIYAWRPPTISLGYFQPFSAIEALPAELRALAVVRRLTGGGAILHDREVTYALTLGAALPIARQSPASLYALVHECWRAALARHGVATSLAPDAYPLPSPRGGPFFCFEKPGRTDLLFGDAKLLGSAQRRLPGRTLQHGSLILGQRYTAHPGARLDEPGARTVNDIVDLFLTHVSDALHLPLFAGGWTPAMLSDVGLRRERYAGDAWTRKR